MGALWVRCLDENDEDTDILDGHFVRVRATGPHASRIRLREKPEDPWSEQAILQIHQFVEGQWGVMQPLEVEDDTMSVALMIDTYGLNPALFVACRY